MTQAEKELRDYLWMMAECYKGNGPKPRGWRYHGPADLLVTEGEFFRPGKRATKWKHRMPQACFRNAAMYACEHGLRYVEGYATAIIPVHHGWCVDETGTVTEVTWKDMGSAYFGVEFPPLWVEHGSVLFNENSLEVYKSDVRRSGKNRYERKPKGAQQNA